MKNRKIKIDYRVFYEYDITEALEITDELLSQLGLDESNTDEEIIEAIYDDDTNYEYLEGYNCVGLIGSCNYGVITSDIPKEMDISIQSSNISEY